MVRASFAILDPCLPFPNLKGLIKKYDPTAWEMALDEFIDSQEQDESFSPTITAAPITGFMMI